MKKLITLLIVAMATTLTALAEDATFETITEALNYNGDRSAVTKLIITGTIAGDDYSDESEWSKFLYLDETFPNLESIEILTEQDIPDGNPYAGNGLFLSLSKWLKNFSAPNIKKIGNYAFYFCTSLELVNFPLVTTIGSYVFTACLSLVSVNFPLVTTIGYYAFCDCYSLESVSFPMATKIEGMAFWDCYSLISVSFPMVADIGGMVFSGCYSLESVDFPSSTNIGNSAFSDCSSLVSLNFPVATKIEGIAFQDCSSLVSVSFPMVADIWNMAFENCYSLVSVNFPMLTGIGNDVFGGCSNLVLISLGTGFTTSTKIISYADYYSFSNTKEIDLCLGEYVLPDYYYNFWNGYTWKSINESDFCDMSVKEKSIATHFTISPNPTSADAVASFGLLESGEITIEVCDLLGECFYSITNFYDAGEHSVILEIKGISSGNYICRLLSKGKQIGTEGFVMGR